MNNIEEIDFPYEGHDLSPREKKILADLVGNYMENFYLSLFNIKVEDHYYYTKFELYYNRFEDFNELKEYILSWYYMHTNSPKKLIEHLKTTKLDLSFDENTSIEWAQHNRCKDLIRLLLNDERVISKLTQEERNEYIEIILGFR